MNGPRLALLQLAAEEDLSPEEATAEVDADAALTAFGEENPDVAILRPAHPGEPWRAEIREGAFPGGHRTTRAVRGAYRPSELLRDLRELFGGDPEDDPG